MTQANRPSRSGDGTAAFFDVDNTIIRGASLFHLAQGLRRRGYLKNRDILRFGWEQLRYVLLGETQNQMEELQDRSVGMIAGWSVAEMKVLADEIYDEVLSLRIFPGTHAILTDHIDKGHQVWLVTASPQEVGELIARRLGATGALGTLSEQEDGLYTGKLIGGLMHGAAKGVAVKKLADERGIDLSKSYAYGDSMNDVHMLSEVGHPCPINPDLRLRKHAHKMKWPVKEFRKRRSNGRRGMWATTAAGTVWALTAIARGIKTAIGAVFSKKN